MKNAYLFSLLTLILLVNKSIGQDSWCDYFTYSEEVQEIVIDGGYIWAATHGGLVQIDRESLQKIVCHRGNSRLPSHRVSHLVKDGSGIVFVKAGNGTLSIVGNELLGFGDQLQGIPARGIFDDLWIAGDSGIWKREQNRWAKFGDLPETANWYTLTDFVVDPFNEDLWISGWTFGSFRLFHFDGSEWDSFGYDNSNLPFESPGNNKLAFDQRGDLWAATQAGLYQYNGNTWKQVFIAPDLGPFFGCSAIYLDEEKRLWVACNETWDKPVRLFTKDADEWIEYPLQDSIGLINDIRVTQREIWLATQGQGLYLHREGEAWQRLFLSNSQITSNWITALDWDQKENQIWVGVQGRGEKAGRLYHVKAGELIPEALPPTDYIRQIVRDPDGLLWVVTGDDVFVKNGNFWNNFNPGTGRIQSQYIEAISFDHQGKLWMIHNDELVIKEWNNQYTYLSHADVKQSAAMYNLFHHPDRDEVWVSSYREFSHFNGGRWNSSEEIFGERVIMYDAVADPQGVVWLATDKGLYRYDSLRYEQFKPADPRDPHKFKSITQKPDGSLWLTTGDRVWKFTEEEGFFPSFWTGPGGWGVNNSPLADRAELLQADDQGNLWIASHGLGVWNDELIPWTIPHEIGIGGDLSQGEHLIYPNPVSLHGTLNIFIKEEPFDRGKLFDITGRDVMHFWLPEPQEFCRLSLSWFDGNNFLPGTYLLQVFRGEKPLLVEKIIIRYR